MGRLAARYVIRETCNGMQALRRGRSPSVCRRGESLLPIGPAAPGATTTISQATFLVGWARRSPRRRPNQLMPTPQICDASLQSGALKPNRAIESNRNLSWRSLLLDIHEGAGRCDPFDTHCTADLAVIVSISGRHETEVVKRGRWRIAVYEPGSAGLIAGQNIARLRWNALDRAPFQTAHIRGVRSHHVSSGGVSSHVHPDRRCAGSRARFS